MPPDSFLLVACDYVSNQSNAMWVERGIHCLYPGVKQNIPHTSPLHHSITRRPSWLTFVIPTVTPKFLVVALFVTSLRDDYIHL